MPRKIYQEFSALVGAYHNCVRTGNDEWRDKHKEQLERMVEDYMPHGSGFDCGVKLLIEISDSNMLIFTTSYHHMDEGGGYDGWTDHTIKVSGHLCFGFTSTISGRNRNDIKAYITETFEFCLNTDMEDITKNAIAQVC